MTIRFWKDKTKNQIDPELFSTKAEGLAKKVFEESKQGKINKPTQIRKFYDEVLRFSGMLKNNPEEFNNILPYIKMLNAKAYYALGRDLISEGFKDFVADSIKQISDARDFEVFANFFEAFMGFYKFYGEKENVKDNRKGGEK